MARSNSQAQLLAVSAETPSKPKSKSTRRVKSTAAWNDAAGKLQSVLEELERTTEENTSRLRRQSEMARKLMSDVALVARSVDCKKGGSQ